MFLGNRPLFLGCFRHFKEKLRKRHTRPRYVNLGGVINIGFNVGLNIGFDCGFIIGLILRLI